MTHALIDEERTSKYEILSRVCIKGKATKDEKKELDAFYKECLSEISIIEKFI
jgi:hypothetical protein